MNYLKVPFVDGDWIDAGGFRYRIVEVPDGPVIASAYDVEVHDTIEDFATDEGLTQVGSDGGTTVVIEGGGGVSDLDVEALEDRLDILEPKVNTNHEDRIDALEVDVATLLTGSTFTGGDVANSIRMTGAGVRGLYFGTIHDDASPHAGDWSYLRSPANDGLLEIGASEAVSWRDTATGSELMRLFSSTGRLVVHGEGDFQTITVAGGIEADSLDGADGTLTLKVGGATKATLTATGTGLGTATPNRRLEVQDATAYQARLTHSGSSFADLGVSSSGAMTINPSGELLYIGGDLLPDGAYTRNLGSANSKWLTMHAGELWMDTVVAHENISTVGGRLLIGTSTTLTRVVSPGDTTIYTRHNNLSANDILRLEARGVVEFIRVGGGPTTITAGGWSGGEFTDGEYAYTVIRDEDGSGANTWAQGDAVFNTGVKNSGFIDLYAEESLSDFGTGNAYGPSIRIKVRDQDHSHGGTYYNKYGDRAVVGALRGSYGYGFQSYGIAAGDYDSTWVSMDDDHGFRVSYRNEVKAHWDVDGSVTLGGINPLSSFYFMSGQVFHTMNAGSPFTTFNSGTPYPHLRFDDEELYLTDGEVKHLRILQTGEIWVGPLLDGYSAIHIDSTSASFWQPLPGGGHLEAIRMATDGTGHLANANVRWTATGDFYIDGNAEIAGWTVTSDKLQSGTTGATKISLESTATTGRIYVGAGTYGNDNTAFYVDEQGRFSLGNELTWDGSTLAIAGDVSIIADYNGLTNRPDDLADINATEGAKLTGIEDNATVGSAWGTDLTGIPARFGDSNTPAVAGLYLTATHMGYHTGSGDVAGWKVYFQNDGQFHFGGDDDNYVDWDGATMAVKGAVTITAGSGYGNLTDIPTQLSDINSGESTKLAGIEASATVGSAWGTDLTGIPARFGDDDTPAVAGLYLTATHLGFHNGNGAANGWLSYIQNDGQFHFGDDTSYVDWNNATLSIRGSITITGGSGYANLTDKPTTLAGINATEGAKLGGVEDNATAGATWGSDIGGQPADADLLNANQLWSEVGGAGRPADNATVGASWGSNLIGQPTDNELLNANQIWSEVGGAGKPADNATVGASWTSNLTNIPSRMGENDSPTVAGLYLAPNYLGYSDGSSWTSYIASDGSGVLAGGQIAWDAAGNLNVDAVLSVGNLPGMPLDAFLVGFWNFDEGTGTLALDQAGTNNGTLGAGVSWDTQAVSGRALSFDGASAGITLDSTISLTSNGLWSISYWFEQDVVSRMTLGKTGEDFNRIYHRGGVGNETVKIHFNNGTTADIGNYTSAAYVANGWHHFVLVSDGTNYLGYIDGVLIDTISTHAATTLEINSIGNPYTGTAYSWDGKLDEIRIYDIALTVDNVRGLYLNPSGPVGTVVSGDRITTGKITSANWNGTNAGSRFDLNGGTLELGGAGAAAKLWFDGTDLILQGEINAASGDVGGWTVGATTLTGGNIQLSSAGSIVHTGGAFSFNNDSTGTLAGGNISWTAAGEITLANFTTSDGTVGGWDLSATGLEVGNIKLASNGSISHTGGKWALNDDGSGQFATSKISWDATGNASFDGTLYARSGLIEDSVLIGGTRADLVSMQRFSIENGMEDGEFDLWSVTAGHTIAQDAAALVGTYSGLASSTTASAVSANAEGVRIAIPANVAAQFAGRRVIVRLYVKQPAAGASALGAACYTAVGSGSSGWVNITPTASWTAHSFEYDVPSLTVGRTDYFVIWGDKSGAGNGMLIDRVMIETAPRYASNEVTSPGLYLTKTYLGYYDGAAWQTKIENDGTFSFGGGNLTWNNTKLSVTGIVSADQGDIGGWDISSSELSKGDIHLVADTAIYVSSAGVNGYANADTPVWIGTDGKVSLRDKFLWDGNDLTLTTTLTALAGSTIGGWGILSDRIAGGIMELMDFGAIRTNDYGGVNSGYREAKVFVGLDGGVAKFSIGDSLYFDGTTLYIDGTETSVVGGGTLGNGLDRTGDTMSGWITFDVTTPSADTVGVRWTGLSDSHQIFVRELDGTTNTALIIKTGNSSADYTMFKHYESGSEISTLELRRNRIDAKVDVYGTGKAEFDTGVFTTSLTVAGKTLTEYVQDVFGDASFTLMGSGSLTGVYDDASNTYTLDTVQGIETTDSPSFAGLTVAGKTLVEYVQDVVGDAAFSMMGSGSLTGTYDDGANTYTIDTIQGIMTSSTPTFAGMTLNGQLTVSTGGIDVTGAATFNQDVTITGSAARVLTIMSDAGSTLRLFEPAAAGFEVKYDAGANEFQLNSAVSSPYTTRFKIARDTGYTTISGSAHINGTLALGGDANSYLQRSGDYINIRTQYGYGSFGAANANHFHFYTDRPDFWMGTDLYVSGWVRPNADNTRTLGDVSYRWSHIYGMLGTFSSHVHANTTMSIGGENRSDIGQLYVRSADTSAGKANLRLRSVTNSDESYIRFHAVDSGSTVRYADIAFDPDTTDLVFRNNYLTDALRIDSAQKLWIGTTKDTNLYRSAANILKTDDEFRASKILSGPTAYASGFYGGGWIESHDAVQASVAVNVQGKGGYIYTNGTTTKFDAYNWATPGAMNVQIGGNGGDIILAAGDVRISTDGKKLYFGAAMDTNLYRSAANTLTTDDALVVGGTLSVVNAGSTLYGAGFRRSATFGGTPDIWGDAGYEGVVIGYGVSSNELYVGDGAITATANLTVTGFLGLNATQRAYFDLSSGSHTYIYESSNDNLDFVVAGDIKLRLGADHIKLDTGQEEWVHVGPNQNADQAIKASRFGYSAGYRVLQLGNITSNSTNLSLGADVSGIASGSFRGKHIIIPNATAMIAVNGAGGAYKGILEVDASDNLLIGGAYVPGILKISSDNTAERLVIDAAGVHAKGGHFDVTTGTASVGRASANGATLSVDWVSGTQTARIRSESSSTVIKRALLMDNPAAYGAGGGTGFHMAMANYDLFGINAWHDGTRVQASMHLAASDDFMYFRREGSDNVRVGIDVAVPFRKLHIGGNFAVNDGDGQYYGHYFQGGEGTNPRYLIGDWWNKAAILRFDSTGGYFGIRMDDENGADLFQLMDSGDVRIGASSFGATYKFTVSGVSDGIAIEPSDSPYGTRLIIVGGGPTDLGATSNVMTNFSGVYATNDTSLVSDFTGYEFRTAGTARVRILPNGHLSSAVTVGSPTFTSGILGAGWRLDTATNYLEIDNVYVRDTFRTHIFQKDIVRAANGYLLVSDSAQIAEDTTSASLTIKVADDDKNATFQIGDLCWYKDIENGGAVITGIKFTIADAGTTVDGITTYAITIYSGTGTFRVGGTFVRVGSSLAARQGAIMIDASSQYAPFIDIIDGVAAWTDFQSTTKTKVRLGALSGITDAAFGTLTGYGIYTNRGYFTDSVAVGGTIRMGATAYNAGTGFWVDNNGGTPQMRMGVAGAQRMQWTGTNVEVYNASNVAVITSTASGAVVGGWTLGATAISSSLNPGTAGSSMYLFSSDNSRPSIRMGWGDGTNTDSSGANYISLGGSSYMASASGQFTATGWDHAGGGLSININNETVFFAGRRGTTNGAVIAGWSFRNGKIWDGSTGYSDEGTNEGEVIRLRSGSSVIGGNNYNASMLRGLQMQWHQSGNAGSLVLGETYSAADGSYALAANSWYGLQMAGYAGEEYFKLAAKTDATGGMNVYNQIAGWRFDSTQLWSGAMQISTAGYIRNTNDLWRLNADGSGTLAGGDISWTAGGQLTISHQGRNLIENTSDMNWVEAASPVTEPSGWHLSGAIAEYDFEFTEGPFGSQVVAFHGMSDAGGGWDGYIRTATMAIDPTKTYRLHWYVKRNTDATSSTVYFGTYESNDTLNANGGAPTPNPYFYNTNGYKDDEWYLWVGYYHHKDYVYPGQVEGAVYKVSTGEKVASASADFKFASGATNIYSRIGLYGGTGVGPEAWFYSPGIFVMDGSEPSISELLGGFKPSTVISGDQITTGTIQSSNWAAGAGSQFLLNDGTFKLGGSSAPTLSWDTSTLTVIGNVTVTNAKDFAFEDTFPGTTLSDQWVEAGTGSVAVANGYAVLTGSAGWNYGMAGTGIYHKADEPVIEYDIEYTAGDVIMFGWCQHDLTAWTYANLRHSWYLNGNDLRVYEATSQMASWAGVLTYGDRYTLRIRLKSGGGAYYELFTNGDFSAPSYTHSSNVDRGPSYKAGISANSSAAATRIHRVSINSTKSSGIVSANMVKTGVLQSTNWSTTLGSQFDMDGGTFKLGGSDAPKLSWDGSTLAIDGEVTAATGNIGGWDINSTSISKINNSGVNGSELYLYSTNNSRAYAWIGWGDGTYSQGTGANSVTLGGSSYTHAANGQFTTTGWDHTAGGLSINVGAKNIFFAGKRGTTSGAAIAGWSFDEKEIWFGDTASAGNVHVGLRSAASIASSSNYNSNNTSTTGLNIQWHQSSNAGALIVGETLSDANGNYALAANGFYGIHMVDYTGVEYFRLSAKTTGNSIVTKNHIAGWQFTKDSLSDANSKIQLRSDTAAIQINTGVSAAGKPVFVMFGQTYVSNAWTGSYGISAQDNAGATLFRLDGAVNQIAGWTFDNTKLTSGNIELNTAGYIRNTANTWKLDSAGSGQLAGGAISWDSNGRLLIKRQGENLLNQHDLSWTPSYPTDPYDTGGTLGTWTRPALFTGDNGGSTKNRIVMTGGPFGGDVAAWMTVPDAANASDGGWHTAYVPVDPEKTYRFHFYVKRTGDANGSTYHGVAGGVYRITDGVLDGNFYFGSDNAFVMDEWYLWVGHIFPASYDRTNGSHPDSGIWRLSTGQKTVNKNDGYMQAATTQLLQRVYMYYCTNTANRQYNFGPGIYVVDGNEPSVSELVGGFTSSTVIDGGQITTGEILSNNWSTSAGSKIALTDGHFYLGGSSAPKLSWNGSTLAVDGTITATAGAIGGWTVGTTKLSSGTALELDATNKRLAINNAEMLLGYDVGGAGKHGLHIDSNDYWYGDGTLSLANGNLLWDGTALDGTFTGDIKVTRSWEAAETLAKGDPVYLQDDGGTLKAYKATLSNEVGVVVSGSAIALAALQESSYAPANHGYYEAQTQVCNIDDDTLVVSFFTGSTQLKFCVTTVSEAGVLTEGTSYTVNFTNSFTRYQVQRVSSTKFVVVTWSTSQNVIMTLYVGTVTGTAISFGSEVTRTTGHTDEIDDLNFSVSGNGNRIVSMTKEGGTVDEIIYQVFSIGATSVTYQGGGYLVNNPDGGSLYGVWTIGENHVLLRFIASGAMEQRLYEYGNDTDYTPDKTYTSSGLAGGVYTVRPTSSTTWYETSGTTIHKWLATGTALQVTTSYSAGDDLPSIWTGINANYGFGDNMSYGTDKFIGFDHAEGYTYLVASIEVTPATPSWEIKEIAFAPMSMIGKLANWVMMVRLRANRFLIASAYTSTGDRTVYYGIFDVSSSGVITTVVDGSTLGQGGSYVTEPETILLSEVDNIYLEVARFTVNDLIIGRAFQINPDGSTTFGKSLILNENVDENDDFVIGRLKDGWAALWYDGATSNTSKVRAISVNTSTLALTKYTEYALSVELNSSSAWKSVYVDEDIALLRDNTTWVYVKHTGAGALSTDTEAGWATSNMGRIGISGADNDLAFMNGFLTGPGYGVEVVVMDHALAQITGQYELVTGDFDHYNAACISKRDSGADRVDTWFNQSTPAYEYKLCEIAFDRSTNLISVSDPRVTIPMEGNAYYLFDVHEMNGGGYVGWMQHGTGDGRYIMINVTSLGVSVEYIRPDATEDYDDQSVPSFAYNRVSGTGIMPRRNSEHAPPSMITTKSGLSDLIGVTSAAANAGQSVPVILVGSVADVYSGLKLGKKYYFKNDSSLALESTPFVAGIALTATSLILNTLS